jgi:hypothetical protein
MVWGSGLVTGSKERSGADTFRKRDACVLDASHEGTRRAKAVHGRNPFSRNDMAMRRTPTVRRDLVQRSPN